MLPRRRFCHSQRQQRGTTRFIVTSECERSNDIMLRTMKNLADIDILGCVIVGDAERSEKTVVKKDVNGTSGSKMRPQVTMRAIASKLSNISFRQLTTLSIKTHVNNGLK